MVLGIGFCHELVNIKEILFQVSDSFAGLLFIGLLIWI